MDVDLLNDINIKVNSNENIHNIQNTLKEVFNECYILLQRAILTDLQYQKIGNIPLLILELIEETCNKKPYTSLSLKERTGLCFDLFTNYIEKIGNIDEEGKTKLKILMPNIIDVLYYVAKNRKKIKIYKLKKDRLNRNKNTIIIAENLWNKLHSMLITKNITMDGLLMSSTSVLFNLLLELNEYKCLTFRDYKVILKNVFRRLENNLNDIFDNVTLNRELTLEYYIKNIGIILENIYIVYDGNTNLSKTIK
jgi:hypothetical protein